MTIDGPAGSGKSSIAEAVHRRLSVKGWPTVLTREPSDSELGNLARYQHDNITGLSLACLVAADRYDHLTTLVRPAVLKGSIVVSDRYVPSSYVLQRMDDVPVSYISDLNQFAEPPDLCVILIAAPEICAQRVAARGSHGRFHSEVGQSMLEVQYYEETIQTLTERGWNVLTIDSSSQDIQGISDTIVNQIVALISST